MGASPAAILPFVQDSPNFTNRRFEGEEPSLRPRVKAQTSALLAAVRVSGRGRPAGTVPVVIATPPRRPGELAVTWYGHATSVLEIDGARFLIDLPDLGGAEKLRADDIDTASLLAFAGD